MFESGFSEGIPSDLSKRKRSIRMMPEDSFDLHQKILQFMYTSEISYDSETKSSQHSPYLCEAEEIYAIADRLLLSDLKALSLDFLSRSCTTENIVTRLFGPLSLEHDKVRAIYTDFSFLHTEEFFREEALQGFIEKLKEEDDVELLKIVCDWEYHQLLRLCKNDRSIQGRRIWEFSFCDHYS